MKKIISNSIDKIKENKLVIIFFVVLFFIGVFTFKDYGVSVDELTQRHHTMINYNEYLKVIKDITKIDIDDIKKTEEYELMAMKFSIGYYPYKYYGIGIQLPTIIIEQFAKFNLELSASYYIRHFYTFLIYFISMIYFYLTLKSYILKDKRYALIGTLFLVISPRIYGDAFYNIKDLMFMSLCIINCYYCLKFLEDDRLKNIIKLSIITAFTINSRIIGGIIIFMCFIFKLLLNKSKLKNTLPKLLKVFIFTYAFYFIMTPPMWFDPIMHPFKAINFFFNYEDPASHYVQQCYYFGKWLDSTKLPWHYIPVWIFITTPILYTILFFMGSLKNIITIVKNKLKRLNINILFTNTILIIILLLVIILRPTTYGGWRHFYWIYPLIIINSIIGLIFIMNKLKNIKVPIIIIISISLLTNIIWMIRNHPYQYNYFNLLTRKYTIKNFAFNYYKIPNNDALKYIAEIDDRDKIFVKSEYNHICYILLDSKDRKRIIIEEPKKDFTYDDSKEYDYIIDSNIYANNEIKDKYKEIKYKKMDGVRLYTIYKHK